MKVSGSINTYGKRWEKVKNYRGLNWRKCPDRGEKKVLSLLFLTCSFCCVSSFTEKSASKGWRA